MKQLHTPVFLTDIVPPTWKTYTTGQGSAVLLPVALPQRLRHLKTVSSHMHADCVSCNTSAKWHLQDTLANRATRGKQEINVHSARLSGSTNWPHTVARCTCSGGRECSVARARNTPWQMYPKRFQPWREMLLEPTVDDDQERLFLGWRQKTTQG